MHFFYFRVTSDMVFCHCIFGVVGESEQPLSGHAPIILFRPSLSPPLRCFSLISARQSAERAHVLTTAMTATLFPCGCQKYIFIATKMTTLSTRSPLLALLGLPCGC